MKRLLAAVVLASALVTPAVAAPEWIKITSSNFELYTSAGEGDARQTLGVFEQVRDFFMRVKSQSTTTRLPVTIVGFRNEKEFSAYRPHAGAAAYYTGDEQHDYIVMGGLGAEQTPTAIHEYMHLLVRHSGLKVPLWFDEGFADVYSTLKPTGGQVLLGTVPAGRGIELTRSKWIPLDKLVTIDHDSPEYNEKERIGAFYAQSWLLVHMLMLGKDYKDGFNEFVIVLHETRSVEKAFETAYKKKLWEVEMDARDYAKGRTLTGVLFKTQFEKIKIDRAQPARDIEVGITLAKLTALLNRTDEATARFTELARTHPSNAEIEEALAYLSWRQNKQDEAVQHFARAIELGAGSWKTWWDYARLAGSIDSKAYVEALRQTVELKPDLAEARLRLGSELMRTNSWAQALVTLREVKKVEPEQASQLFLMMAYCAMNLQMKDDAQKYAADARKWAKEPAQQESADRLIAYLARSEAVRQPPPPLSESEDAGRPLLAHREAREESPVETSLSGAKRVMVRGNFKRLDCLGEMARMHVTDGRDTFLLLIRKPDSVALRGAASFKDLKCGPQNLGVSVEYMAVKDPQTNTAGEVKVIEFID